jgi:hypothetical protein
MFEGHGRKWCNVAFCKEHCITACIQNHDNHRNTIEYIHLTKGTFFAVIGVGFVLIIIHPVGINSILFIYHMVYFIFQKNNPVKLSALLA